MKENLLLGGIISFSISFYAIPKILKIAYEKHLYDMPDERKKHKEPIPSLGGVAIFAGFVISLLFTIFFDSLKDNQFLLLTFFVVFFFGIKDDLIGLTPKKKLFGQLAVYPFFVYVLFAKDSGTTGSLLTKYLS